MNFFSYKLTHDFGLAPNPFGGYCTLAVCKPHIRNNTHLEVGDWIFGTSGKQLKGLHYLIYAMRVEEKLTFEKYWVDPRFQYKKPIMNGSLVQIYGDNFYYKEDGEWLQLNSAHSLKNGIQNPKHTKNDVKGKFVLLSREFYYFGEEAFHIPQKFLAISCGAKIRGFRRKSIPQKIAKQFVIWLQKNYESGVYGDPISWKRYLKR